MSGRTTVPRVEGTRHKELFGGTFDNGVGENAARLFASPSSTPFHKIGKDRSPSLLGDGQGNVAVSVLSIRCQIDVVNVAEFDVLS
jgi:hypothetical protein